MSTHAGRVTAFRFIRTSLSITGCCPQQYCCLLPTQPYTSHCHAWTYARRALDAVAAHPAALRVLNWTDPQLLDWIAQPPATAGGEPAHNASSSNSTASSFMPPQGLGVPLPLAGQVQRLRTAVSFLYSVVDPRAYSTTGGLDPRFVSPTLNLDPAQSALLDPYVVLVGTVEVGGVGGGVGGAVLCCVTLTVE